MLLDIRGSLTCNIILYRLRHKSIDHQQDFSTMAPDRIARRTIAIFKRTSTKRLILDLEALHEASCQTWHYSKDGG